MEHVQIIHIEGEEYKIDVMDSGGFHYVAYGTYAPDGYGRLDHAPTQTDMDAVAAYVDSLSAGRWKKMLASARGAADPVK